MTHDIHAPRPGRKARRGTRTAGIVAAAIVISWGGPAASAYWQTLGSGGGAAKADFVLSVPPPAVSVASGAASLTWTPGTTAGGRPVSGYTVARYSSVAGSAKAAAGGGCSGEIKTAGCTESGLPVGTWYYTVTPVLGSWTGVESAQSAGAIVADTTRPDAPVINTPQAVNIASAPITSAGGTAEPGSAVTVTVRDSATPQLFAAKTVPADAVTGQWTISNFDLRSLADGVITYTATARDAAGNVSDPTPAESTTKDTVAPSVSGVTLLNGDSKSNNKDGKVEAGDKVILTFSEALDASSICSNWNNLSPVQTGSGVVVTINSSNSLSVTASGCPTLRLGAVALGGAYYSSGILQFTGSSMVWDQSARQLTVTLGAVSGTPGNAAQQPGTPIYTPQSGQKDIAGNPLPVTSINGTPASRF